MIEKLRHHFIPSHYARWRDKPQFDTKFRHIDTAMAEKISTQKVYFTLGIMISCKYLSEVSHKDNKITVYELLFDKNGHAQFRSLGTQKYRKPNFRFPSAINDFWSERWKSLNVIYPGVEVRSLME
jgi:hypothetical protein